MEGVSSAQRRQICRLLRTIRREREVTQAELADRLAVPQSVISKVERGERRLDLAELKAVCEALGTSVSTFCRRWDSMPEDLEGE